MAPAPDRADTVARRRDVLAALSTPRTKPALVDWLDASRSTVDRAIEALTDHGYVEQRGSEYLATYAGREAVAAYDRFLDRLDVLEAAQPVLGALPVDVDIPPAILEGATVVESEPEAPEAPVEANVPVVLDATRFRGTGPAVIPRYVDVIGSLLDQGTETELVLTDSVLDVLSDRYLESLSMFEDDDAISVYVTDERMPYAVWTAERPDRTVSGIVVYGDNGVVGTINNDTEPMHEFVREEYERCKRDARRVD